ncbi:redoxin domain-containing protein [Candidatus Woesearchaeota archaeon]|nr:redoxin domain-containing protein [Candidatus Woesearchaeota archaeon]
MNYKIVFGLMGIIAATLFLLSGCSHTEISKTSIDSSIVDTEPIGFNPETKTMREKLPETILSAQLKDVNSQKFFSLNDFKGKPVLVESFAVWCPVCTKQQQEIKKLHDDVGGEVISVSLDTDPNEDEEKVKEHLKANGFNWYYAVSPSDLTKELIEQFSTAIINAPQAPVMLICPDQSAEILRRGVKSASELKEAISSCG